MTQSRKSNSQQLAESTIGPDVPMMSYERGARLYLRVDEYHDGRFGVAHFQDHAWRGELQGLSLPELIERTITIWQEVRS